MTLRDIVQCVLAGLAAGVFVIGSAILGITLLVVNSQDFAIVNTVYFEIYPLFLLSSWLCTIATVFLRYPVSKALFLMLLFLFIGGGGYVFLSILMGLVGGLTGDGFIPETSAMRAAIAVFIIPLLSISSGGAMWQARQVLKNPRHLHPRSSTNREA